MFAGCARTGARFVAVTLMVNDFVSLAVPSLADTDAVWDPTGSDAPAARWMFPVVAFVVVTVMNVGPVTFENVSASPSASEAVMAWSEGPLCATDMFAGCVRTGARFTLFTVTVKDF